jgi:hypothetical protein
MRRWLAILLLLLLPAQATWAVVAPYCAHEAAPQAQHLGHHEHQHHDQPDQSQLAAGLPDLDCGQCHGHGAAVVLAALQLAAGPLPAQPVCAAAVPLRARAAAPPERPQWLRLA